MATYYDTTDFEIFKPYFDEDISIEKFVESLNYVSDETNGDKTLEVCEFMHFMKKIKEVNKTLFDLLINLMNSKENNTLSVYIYLKFLLLSIEEKEKLMTYIDRLQELNENFEYQCPADILTHKPLDVVLRMIFEIYDDAYFNDFIDYKDTFGQYRELDMSSYYNFADCNPDYMKQDFINIFVESIRFFLRTKIVIQFIYLISDKNQTKVLNEGETSITSIEDFIRRFEKNIDTFIIFYNINWVKLDVEASSQELKLIVAQIPSNKVIKTRNTTEYHDSNMKQICFYIRYKLFASFLLKHLRHYHSKPNCYNSWDEMYNKSTQMFLTIKYDYDITEDSYNIFRYLNYNKTHSDFLLQRYNDYFKSKLYQSLKNIHILKAKLSDVTTCYKFKITQKEREDLYQFLYHLLATYNYCRFFRYNIYM